jgi:hypothetical protein
MNYQIVSDGSLERFIPVSKKALIADLANSFADKPQEQQWFSDFTRLITAIYHYRFHYRLSKLKAAYVPFNPDRDEIDAQDFSPEALKAMHNKMAEEAKMLVEKANYLEIDRAEIFRLMNERSAFGVEVSIDLEDYSELVLYARGSAIKREEVRTWKTLFLKKEVIDTPIFKRLFILLQFKSEEQRIQELMQSKGITEKKAAAQVRQQRAALPRDISTNHIYIKLFKNIPRSDVATLFPNQQIKLKKWDKIRFAVTGGGGTLAGVIGALTKILVSLNPITLIMTLFGFAGVIFRQVMSVLNQRTHYMMLLSRNLYFHNLSNNFGVITYTLDMAEDEEVKEAILAYYFLLQAPQGLTSQEIDEKVEEYLRTRYHAEIDFEISDGLAKLLADDLVEQQGEIYTAKPLLEVCQLLDKYWDNIFSYA